MKVIKCYIVFLNLLILLGCIGPFKKQPVPNSISEQIVTVYPEISLEWKKIRAIQSDKAQIINLIGDPDFVDNHNAGEDWYYSHDRSIDYGLISFPVKGHLVNHAQYIKYPEWR